MTIKELRQQTGLSQREFADIFHLNTRTLQTWEQGTRKTPAYVLWAIENLSEHNSTEKYVTGAISFRPITEDEKNMSQGMRDMSKTPLTESEIDFVKKQAATIKIPADILIFNDPGHIESGTAYDFTKDKIYVTRNVFPDTKYFSTHPRDILSVRAVLAHEYYGHRPNREEYLTDRKNSPDPEHPMYTTPLWEDECRASINAAKTTPGLTQKERSDLLMDAIYRAKENYQLIEIDDSMKEIMYGYSSKERKITYPVVPIRYVDEASIDGIQFDGHNHIDLSEVRD